MAKRKVTLDKVASIIFNEVTRSQNGVSALIINYEIPEIGRLNFSFKPSLGLKKATCDAAIVILIDNAKASNRAEINLAKNGWTKSRPHVFSYIDIGNPKKAVDEIVGGFDWLIQNEFKLPDDQTGFLTIEKLVKEDEPISKPKSVKFVKSDSAMSPSEYIADQSAEGPSGLGGWLVLLVIGLPLGLIREAAGLLDAIMQPVLIASSSTSGSQILIILQTGSLIYLSYLTYLFFNKRQRFKAEFCRYVAYSFLYLIVSIQIGTGFNRFMQADISFVSVFSPLVGMLIWVLYLNISVRVRNTFIN